MKGKKLTVLMPTYNSAAALPLSLDALVQLPWLHEVLVADGGSSDSTLDILGSYGGIVRLVSRRDNSLYDGVNKTMDSISGDYVLFMNSDDIVQYDYIDDALCLLESGRCDFVYGNILYGDIIKYARYKDLDQPNLMPCQRMPFPHVSLIMGADLFKRIGGFSTQYKISGDLDFIHRLLLETKRGLYINKIGAFCANDGLSSGNKQVWESMRIAVKYGRSKIYALAIAIGIYFYRQSVSILRY